MTNLMPIYLDNEVLYPLINNFLRKTFMRIFYRYKDDEKNMFISVNEYTTTWRKCINENDKVELEFKILVGKPENGENPPEYAIIDSPMYIKIYASNENYDNAFKRYEKNELLYEPENTLTHSLYQKLLYVMIEENTLDSIKIRYPYNPFKYFGIQSFLEDTLYDEYVEKTLKYFRLLDEGARAHIIVNIKDDKIDLTNTIEFKKTTSSFYYPAEIDLFFDKNFGNRESLFWYYSVLLKKFYEIEIESLFLMNNFENLIIEIEKTIILLKY